LPKDQPRHKASNIYSVLQVAEKLEKVVIPNAVRDLLLLKTKQIPHLGKNRRGSE